jgi:hypothetical protein
MSGSDLKEWEQTRMSRVRVGCKPLERLQTQNKFELGAMIFDFDTSHGSATFSQKWFLPCVRPVVATSATYEESRKTITCYAFLYNFLVVLYCESQYSLPNQTVPPPVSVANGRES